MTVRTLIGDCRTILPTLAADSFDCVVTSPPYWGLRDYGVEGQMGLEPTLDGYVDALAGVGRELWRVLKPSGTFWLNLGDTYNNADKWGGGGANTGKHTRGTDGEPESWKAVRRKWGKQVGLKPKDLCMVPARVALRLQADGWWLRSEVIWAKPNGMPGSQIDRCTSSHETIFLLSKSASYWSDFDAIKTPPRESSRVRLAQDVQAQAGSHRANGGGKTNGPMKAVAAGDKQRGHSRRHAGFNDRWDAMSKAEQQASPAMMRDVWFVPPEPNRTAHFAIMPSEIAFRCILAGCPPGGHLLDPFGGSGTTGLVADRLGRNATLIELSPAYADLQIARIEGDGPLFADVVSERL